MSRQVSAAATGIVFMLCAVTGSAGQQPAQTPAPPVFRTGTNLVLVDAYPQRDGQIVEGLTANDFQILEDGTPQKVEAFEFVRVEPGQVTSTRRDPNNLREMYAEAADPHARVFVAFLDTLHTAVDGSDRIRAPLVATLNRVINPDDLFGVTTQKQRATDLALGRRLETVEAQLAKYWSWGQRQRLTYDLDDPVESKLNTCFHQLIPPTSGVPIDWMVSDGAVLRFLDELLIERRREDRVLTSLEDLVRHLGTIREARTVLMVISDGWRLFDADRALENQPTRDVRFPGAVLVNRPGPGMSGQTQRTTDGGFIECVGELNRLAQLDNSRRIRDLIALANRSNVSFYPVSTTGLAAFDQTLSQRVTLNPRAQAGQNSLTQDMRNASARVSSLRTLAEDTDGIAVVENNDLAAGMKRIVDDVSAYYLLGYYSTNTKADGRLRRIEVKMKPVGLTVHARRGYIVPTESARAAARGTSSAPAAPAVPTPVDDALAALGRIRPGADLSTYGTVTGGELTVSVELASRQIASGPWTKGGRVTVDAVPANGAPAATGSGVIDAGQRGTLVRVPVGAGTGPWRVTTKLVGGVESLDDRIDVAETRGALVGDPIVYRATPSPRSPLAAVADFQFRRVERIHIEWPVLKPLDQRVARVLDRRGQPIALGATLTERDADGKTSIVVDVNLAPLAEGDYVVEVAAGSGGNTERKLLAFRVVR